MNLEQLQAKMKGLMEEFDKYRSKREAGETYTDAERERLKTLSTEIRETGEQIDTIKGEESNLRDLGTLVDAYRTAPVKGTDPVVQPAGVGGLSFGPSAFKEWFASEGYKQVAAQGVGSSGTFALGKEMSLYARTDPVGFMKDFPEEAKTLVYSGQTGLLQGALQQPYLVPGIQRGEPVERRVRQAFSQGGTNSTAITYVRENVVTNNAGPIVEATSIQASGVPLPLTAKFPESAITFEAATETVKSLGHMIPVTKEMLMDIPLMESYLRLRLIEMLDDKVDSDLLNGAGGSSLVGLENVVGTTVLDATYFTNNPLVSAGEPGENADRIRRARTYLRLVPRVRATDVIINPYDLENLEMQRDDNGNYLFNPSTNGMFQGRAGGLNFVETEFKSAGTAWVVDRRNFWVLDKMENTVEVTDSNREWWEYRILALAVWCRLAFVALRPAAAAEVTLA
jgi:HK97 family phage major capsid protein